jgi:alkaline phosphatase
MDLMPKQERTRTRILAVLLAAVAFLAFRGFPFRPPSPTKNIILMISDGCGYNHIAAASLYQYGRTGAQIYERFPVKLAMSTYSLQGRGYDPKQAWSSPDYVQRWFTDSAAAATAMATGVKTNNGELGMDQNKRRLKNVMEYAQENGYATGVVTTVEFSDATPAAFAAHNAARSHWEEIAREMIFRSKLDVIMGEGNPGFDDNGRPLSNLENCGEFCKKYFFTTVGGEQTWNGLLAGIIGNDVDGDQFLDLWKLVQTRKEFVDLAHGSAPRRVIGVAQAPITLQQARSGDGKAPPYLIPLNRNLPTLAEMSIAALNVLHHHPQGLVVMIEGGAIDRAAHLNQTGRMIEEEIDFNRAVEAVVAWVEANSNWDETLLIVTADHETGYLVGPGAFPAIALGSRGPGRLPDLKWQSDDHTNQLVPIFAKGQAARLFERFAVRMDPVRGAYLDNTDIFRVVLTALQINPEEAVISQLCTHAEQTESATVRCE